MRDEGRAFDHAARAFGRRWMFDFGILNQHRRKGWAFPGPITKRVRERGREDRNVWFGRRHTVSYLAYLVDVPWARLCALPDDMNASTDRDRPWLCGYIDTAIGAGAETAL
jgi:hypothetical protein